jgi:cytochrome c peroxidase
MFLVLTPALLLAGTVAALIPPAPFVLAPNGVDKLDLEAAGIIKSATTDGKTGRQWAIVLGKALFWDQQSGSDRIACASCHFHAGADTRLTNQLNPGFKDITTSFGPTGDVAFGSERSDLFLSDPLYVEPGHMPSGDVAGPNYTLKPEDLPLHQLVDETNRNSPIRTTTNDRVSSQGSFDAIFGKVKKKGKLDKCSDLDASVFHAGPYAARQVEPRNTPTTINAAFFHRNFWDARANNLFNGVGVFGMRDILGDLNKRLIILDANGNPQLGHLQLENASLASQAVGPPLSALEMSCDGRTFADVGRKLLAARPLKLQTVHANDSALGGLVHPSGKGLANQYKYAALIKLAFDEKYWAAKKTYRIVNGLLQKDKNGYTQMEINFPMFWGIAIMLYEATLVSDQSELDSLLVSDLTAARFSAATNPLGCSPTPTGTVDPLLLRGCKIFFTVTGAVTGDGVKGGGCAFCHGTRLKPTATFSEAAFEAGDPFTPFLNPATDVNGLRDLRDLGFANIGLRPVFTDRMSGGTDPYGNPLSFGRQYKNFLGGAPNAVVDPFLQAAITAGTAPVPAPPAPPPNPSGTFAKLEVDGATKIPTMRNVALTPPYFSWGGYPSLRQVLKVYNRGMNRRDITGPTSPEAHGSISCVSGDSSGSGPDGNQDWPVPGPDCNTNTTGLIAPLGLLDCDANDVANLDCVPLLKDTTNDDLAALERFLKSLTDHRVQCDQAPFDHPSLQVFNGHLEADTNGDGRADDIVFELPAVGGDGYDPASGFCIPNAGDLFAPGMQVRSGGLGVPRP